MPAADPMMQPSTKLTPAGFKTAAIASAVIGEIALASRERNSLRPLFATAFATFDALALEQLGPVKAHLADTQYADLLKGHDFLLRRRFFRSKCWTERLQEIS